MSASSAFVRTAPSSPWSSLVPGLVLGLLAFGTPIVTLGQPALPPSGAPTYRVELPGGGFTPPANLDEFFSTAAEPTDIANGVYYRLEQFWELPTKDRRARLEHAWHARLLDYLPLNTYVVAFPASFNRQLLMGYNVRSVFQLDAEQRLAPALRVGSGPSPAPGPDEAAEVLIETVAVLNAPDPAALRAATRAALRAAGATGLVAPDSTAPQRLRARVPLTKLRAVAAIPTVLRVEAVPAPPVRESRPARPTSKTSRKARPRVRHR